MSEGKYDISQKGKRVFAIVVFGAVGNGQGEKFC